MCERRGYHLGGINNRWRLQPRADRIEQSRIRSGAGHPTPWHCSQQLTAIQHSSPTLTVYTTLDLLYSTTCSILRPPVRRIPKRPQQHRDMKMLPLLLLPNHKLDLHLREKRLNAPIPKVPFRIKCQAVVLISIFVEHVLKTRCGEGRTGLPACYATIAVCCGAELQRGVGAGQGV